MFSLYPNPKYNNIIITHKIRYGLNANASWTIHFSFAFYNNPGISVSLKKKSNVSIALVSDC